MYEIKGKYGVAKIMSENLDIKSFDQIQKLMDNPSAEGSKVRIMPDYHYGASCVIGTTMEVKDKVIPNVVGVDIGCGVLAVKIAEKDINLKEIDDFITNNIPSGFRVNKEPIESFDITKLRCLDNLKLTSKDVNRAMCSIGTLGGGNHFIEIDEDSSGKKYIIVHTGSRGLGLKVANYYQDLAIDMMKKENSLRRSQAVDALKKLGKEESIEGVLKNIGRLIPKDMSYLSGQGLEDYLHDIGIIQRYAELNRETIINRIVSEFGFNIELKIESVHNFIEDSILRKGAISAKLGQPVIIPLNMRDGCILGFGRGRIDYNESAPHGAGRVYSRTKAKKEISMDDYIKFMETVYSTSVNKSTLDEAPQAYKNMDEIIKEVDKTVEISMVIKPIYNFKDSKEVYTC